MRNALIALAILLTTPTVASAKPRKASSAELQSASAASDKAKLELKRAKAAAKLAAHRVKLAKAKTRSLKARRALAREQWIADCLQERTGPVGGVSEDEAIAICNAEAPDAAELVDE